MRKFFVVMAGICSGLILASASAADTSASAIPANLLPPPPKKLVLPAPQRVEPPMLAVYEVKLNRFNRTPVDNKAVVELTNMQMYALETQPAVASSYSTITYACREKDKVDVTTCTVQPGFSFKVTPLVVTRASGIVEAQVSLRVVDLESMRERKTAEGSTQEPVVNMFAVEQAVALKPGQSSYVKTDAYEFEVKLVSLK